MRRILTVAAALAALIVPLVFAQDAPAPADEPEKKGPTAEDVPALIEQMGKDDYAGKSAVDQLARVGEDAVLPLLEASRSKDARTRYWAIAALSKIGDVRGRPAIMARLKDDSAFVRSVAVWHLQRWMDEKEVNDAVLAMVDDPTASVRGWVLKVIQTRKMVDQAELVRKVALEDEDPEVRYDALSTATVLLGADAIPLLTEAWRTDKEALVREGAVRCCTLVKPPTPLTGDLLIRALRDKDPKVTETAAKLLRRGFNRFFAFDAEAPVAQRYQAIRDWRNWYEASKDQLKWNEEKHRFELPGEAEDEDEPADTEPETTE